MLRDLVNGFVKLLLSEAMRPKDYPQPKTKGQEIELIFNLTEQGYLDLGY
jgi:hypothetical protein